MSEAITPLSENLTLGAEFTREELHFLHSLMKRVDLSKNSLLFKEGSHSEHFYFIQEGHLAIAKKGHVIAYAGPGDWVGEMGAVTGQTRSASVRTTERCTLLRLSMSKLKKSTKDNIPFYHKIIDHLSRYIVNRLRISNESMIISMQTHLEHAQMQIGMSRFMTYILLALSSFFFLLKIIAVLNLTPRISTLSSIVLILILGIFTYHLIKKSGYPPSTYGLTMKKWKRAVAESLLYTIPILILLFILKIVLLKAIPSFREINLFKLSELLSQHLRLWEWLLLTIGYAIFVPIQEIIVRGCLQGSLNRFLIGKHRVWQSIFLSNLIFSALHLQLSLEIAISVFFAGIFWGWLYSRQGTVIGVSVSHIIIGLFMGVVLGYI